MQGEWAGLIVSLVAQVGKARRFAGAAGLTTPSNEPAEVVSVSAST